MVRNGLETRRGQNRKIHSGNETAGGVKKKQFRVVNPGHSEWWREEMLSCSRKSRTWGSLGVRIEQRLAEPRGCVSCIRALGALGRRWPMISGWREPRARECWWVETWVGVGGLVTAGALHRGLLPPS